IGIVSILYKLENSKPVVPDELFSKELEEMASCSNLIDFVLSGCAHLFLAELVSLNLLCNIPFACGRQHSVRSVAQWSVVDSWLIFLARTTLPKERLQE